MVVKSCIDQQLARKLLKTLDHGRDALPVTRLKRTKSDDMADVAAWADWKPERASSTTAHSCGGN